MVVVVVTDNNCRCVARNWDRKSSRRVALFLMLLLLLLVMLLLLTIGVLGSLAAFVAFGIFRRWWSTECFEEDDDDGGILWLWLWLEDVS